MKLTNAYTKRIYESVREKNPGEPEFLQAILEVLEAIEPAVAENPAYEKYGVLERMVEPERLIQFKVSWVDDSGKVQVNRGFRVQFNSALGPYKGGIRFHPTVTGSVIKFLGFEQTFKNSLTSLPMGGGKGGSDFDPKGKSEFEIMRFCQSFMNELYRHLGDWTDVPAGDIGVSGREVGYMYGQYKKITNEATGVFTGKDLSTGGSLVRTQATGYGLLYIVEEMFKRVKNETLAGKTAVISGSGNVSIYAAEKAQELGMKVLTLSDSGGYIVDEDGIDLDLAKQIKFVERARISEYVNRKPNAKYFEGSTGVWTVKCDVALPCATQNELDGDAAKALVANGVIAVAEGANMPTTPEGTEVFINNEVLFIPGKAANAGGVSTSGLEMAQNSGRIQWPFEEVDAKLKQIMINIFASIYETAKKYGAENNFVTGSNIAGFIKVAQSMMWQGVSN